MDFNAKAQDFLAQKRIAILGASSSGDATGNGILKYLRDKGYEVIPVHPTAATIEDETAYPRLQDIPNGADAAFIVTRPEISEQAVRDCAEAGITRVWMHYNALFGAESSSVSPEAVEFCRANGITVIDGGCPLMFLEFFHKCMRGVLGVMKKLPA